MKRLVGYRDRPRSWSPCCSASRRSSTATARSTPNYEDTTITSTSRTSTSTTNGDLDVTETITVDFPVYGKHGIFRFWDSVDDNAPHARRDPEDITVTRDGSDEPFELS